MLDAKVWKMVANTSPGHEGKGRNEAIAARDAEYGKGKWAMGWLCSELVLEYEEACRFYEDSYYQYLLQRPELATHLADIASEVYDDAPSNIESGQDYNMKGDVVTHIQDIAIRRCFVRLGIAFKGTEPRQIRDAVGRGAISKALSPGQVPCHRPDLITVPDNVEELRSRRWWLPGSVEEAYQFNKRIFVKR